MRCWGLESKPYPLPQIGFKKKNRELLFTPEKHVYLLLRRKKRKREKMGNKELMNRRKESDVE